MTTPVQLAAQFEHGRDHWYQTFAGLEPELAAWQPNPRTPSVSSHLLRIVGFGHLVVAAVELRDLETVRRGVGWSVYTRGFPAELGAPAPLPSPVGDYLQLLQMETNQVASLMRALTADDLAALAWFYPLSEPLRLNQLEPVTTLQLFEYLIAHDAAHYDAINRVLSGRRR